MTPELSQLPNTAKKARMKFLKKSDSFNRYTYHDAVAKFAKRYNAAKEQHYAEMCDALKSSDPKVWNKIN